MGLIVSIVLGLIFYWEGRRLYKETEEHSKLQRIAITIKFRRHKLSQITLYACVPNSTRCYYVLNRRCY